MVCIAPGGACGGADGVGVGVGCEIAAFLATSCEEILEFFAFAQDDELWGRPAGGNGLGL
jgi:hypothetical protein